MTVEIICGDIAAVRKEVNAMMANYPLFAW